MNILGCRGNRILGFAFVLASLVPMTASASWGYVTGRLLFFNNQGNYCNDDGRDCSGARYPKSQYRVNMPVRDVKVYVRRSSDNAIIGQGVANSSGYYTIYWSSPGSGNVDVVKGFVTPQLSRFFRLCQLPFKIVGAHVTQV